MFITDSPYIHTIEFIIFLSAESKPASQEKVFHGKNLKCPHEAIKCDPRARKSLNYSVCSSQFVLFWGLIFLAPLQKITSLRIRSWTVSGILVLSFPNTHFPHFKCITTENHRRRRDEEKCTHSTSYFFFNVCLADDFAKKTQKKQKIIELRPH